MKSFRGPNLRKRRKRRRMIRKKKKEKGWFLKMTIFPIHLFRASGEAILGTQRYLVTFSQRSLDQGFQNCSPLPCVPLRLVAPGWPADVHVNTYYIP